MHGNRLSEDKFWRRYNCVLLTGNGQPLRGIRRLARCLREEYEIRVYVFVDNDPWGYYIYSVVKQGSINLPRTVGIKLNDKLPRKLKEEVWLDQVGLPGPGGGGRRWPRSDPVAPRASKRTPCARRGEGRSSRDERGDS